MMVSKFGISGFPGEEIILRFSSFVFQGVSMEAWEMFLNFCTCEMLTNLNDFAHIPGEDTPNFPKPPKRKNSFINSWWNIWGTFQGYVGEMLTNHNSILRDRHTCWRRAPHQHRPASWFTESPYKMLQVKRPKEQHPSNPKILGSYVCISIHGISL